MKNLIDFHCHLDLFPEFEKAINLCEENKIYTFSVTTTPLAWPKNKELMSHTKYVRPALGLHPQLIGERKQELALWEKYSQETRYIGEVGLDASPKYYSSFEDQKKILRRILKCCSEQGNKIISFHSLRSSRILLEMLEENYIFERIKPVLHWFTGSRSDLEKAIDIGCYFSINEMMLKTERSLKLVENIPIDRILTETDAPFTCNNANGNHLVMLNNTYIQLSDLYKIPVDEFKLKLNGVLKEILKD